MVYGVWGSAHRGGLCVTKKDTPSPLARQGISTGTVSTVPTTARL